MILEDGVATSGPEQTHPCPQCSQPITECKCQATPVPDETSASSFDLSTIVDIGDVVVDVAAEVVGGIIGALFD